MAVGGMPRLVVEDADVLKTVLAVIGHVSRFIHAPSCRLHFAPETELRAAEVSWYQDDDVRKRFGEVFGRRHGLPKEVCEFSGTATSSAGQASCFPRQLQCTITDSGPPGMFS